MGGSVTQFTIEPPDASHPTAATPQFTIEPPDAGGDTPPETPGFFKRLLAPAGPDAGFLESTGAALLGAGPAVYHAFADEPTEEEKMRYAEGEKAAGEAPGTQTSGLKRVGLGVRRLVVDPVADANLGDYTSGKISPRAALSVAPAALGTGVGSFVAGELGGRVVGKLKTPGELKASIQPFTRKFTGVESALKEEVGTAAEKQAKAVGENKLERTATVKENLEKQRAANMKIDQERLATAEKNRRIEAENQGKEGLPAERKAIETKVDQQSLQLREQLGKVEEAVHADADAKFDRVRQKVGNPEADPKPLTDAVKSAETNILQDIPENIKEFRSILGHGEEIANDAGLEDAALRHAGDEGELGENARAALEGPKPMSWDKLQSLKSRIDARLRQHFRGARMNGDLVRALSSVQETIVDTMGDMAEEHGATDLWADAKKTWREYKQDFHEPTGKSGSGSPVAQSLNAVDPKNIRQPFLSKQATTGNRALDILRRYPKHGGTEAAATAEQLLRDHESMRALPEKVTPKPLKELKQAHQMPENKPAPAKPEAPVIDAQKIAREAIAKKAANWGSFNARDVGILAASGLGGILGGIFSGSIMAGIGEALGGVGLYEGAKYTGSRLLNKPAVIDWLAKTPPEEIAVINKIPDVDKVKIINALTNQAVNAGRPVRLSPAARQLLGPANVARILGTSAGVSTVHNRKDALELMGR